MVFVRDEGSLFDAPLEEVWAYLGSGEPHSAAHHHANVDRIREGPGAVSYGWEMPFEGRHSRFRMRSYAFVPLGVVFDVVEGPFEGSRFLLLYSPRGTRTRVSIVGEFRSPVLAESEIAPAVNRFFEREFAEDSAGLREWMARRAR
ncbi:MAG TPA: SRPBCC family protein [Thermoplasmata archaeon]|nr:SRPBCC family protein [Thermoplasmata archaeon]